jgi:hypothetical protein
LRPVPPVASARAAGVRGGPLTVLLAFVDPLGRAGAITRIAVP